MTFCEDLIESAYDAFRCSVRDVEASLVDGLSYRCSSWVFAAASEKVMEALWHEFCDRYDEERGGSDA